MKMAKRIIIGVMALVKAEVANPNYDAYLQNSKLSIEVLDPGTFCSANPYEDETYKYCGYYGLLDKPAAGTQFQSIVRMVNNNIDAPSKI